MENLFLHDAIYLLKAFLLRKKLLVITIENSYFPTMYVMLSNREFFELLKGELYEHDRSY